MDLSSLFTVAALMNNVADEPAWTTVVITGVTIVFGVLILLYLLITLEGVFFSSLENKKKEKSVATQEKPAAAPAKQVAAKSPVVEKGIPAEVVAAITAAIACMDGGNDYTIRLMKRAKTSRNGWGQAGVLSNTEPF